MRWHSDCLIRKSQETVIIMENHTTSDTGEALTKDLAALKRDVTKIATDLKHHAGAHVDATRQRINDKLQMAKDRPAAIFIGGFLLGFLFALRLRR